MIWQVLYDFFFLLMEGSEFASLSADLFALFFTIMIIYMLFILPIQIVIRYIIRFISSISNTPAYYSMKKRFNRAPKD
jgi:ABC-type amino acid transport system permease subunit